MPIKLSTTLNKLESANKNNRVVLKEFYEYMRSKGSRSDRNTNILTLLISLDKYFGGKPFIEINRKEQNLEFVADSCPRILCNMY